MKNLDMSPEFSVLLSGKRADGSMCAAVDCSDEPTLRVTLVYCNCLDRPEEHGHPGRHDEYADRSQIVTCDRHGALIAHGWECFERVTDIRRDPTT